MKGPKSLNTPANIAAQNIHCLQRLQPALVQKAQRKNIHRLYRLLVSYERSLDGKLSSVPKWRNTKFTPITNR
jgi:hypothetical protein